MGKDIKILNSSAFKSEADAVHDLRRDLKYKNELINKLRDDMDVYYMNYKRENDGLRDMNEELKKKVENFQYENDNLKSTHEQSVRNDKSQIGLGGMLMGPNMSNSNIGHTTGSVMNRGNSMSKSGNYNMNNFGFQAGAQGNTSSGYIRGMQSPSRTYISTGGNGNGGGKDLSQVSDKYRDWASRDRASTGEEIGGRLAGYNLNIGGDEKAGGKGDGADGKGDGAESGEGTGRLSKQVDADYEKTSYVISKYLKRQNDGL